MATTLKRAYRYPGQGVEPDVAGDLQKLAEDVDTDMAKVAAGALVQPYREFTGQVAVQASQLWGTGALTADTNQSQNATGITSPAVDTVEVPPGLWLLHWRAKVPNNLTAGNTMWGSLRDSPSTDPAVWKELDSFDIQVGNSTGTMNALFRTTAPLTRVYLKFWCTQTGQTLTSRVRVMRAGTV